VSVWFLGHNYRHNILVLQGLRATRVAKTLCPHPLTPNSQFPHSWRAFRRQNRHFFAIHKRTSIFFHARVTSRRAGPPRSSGSPSLCAQLRPTPHPLTPKSQLPLLSRPARGLRPRLGVGSWDFGGWGNGVGTRIGDGICSYRDLRFWQLRCGPTTPGTGPHSPLSTPHSPLTGPHPRNSQMPTPSSLPHSLRCVPVTGSRP